MTAVNEWRDRCQQPLKCPHACLNLYPYSYNGQDNLTGYSSIKVNVCGV